MRNWHYLTYICSIGNKYRTPKGQLNTNHKPQLKIDYRMRAQNKDTAQRHKERAEKMEKRYIELWKKGISPSLILTTIANENCLSSNRVSEILRPRKLRVKLGLK